MIPSIVTLYPVDTHAPHIVWAAAGDGRKREVDEREDRIEKRAFRAEPKGAESARRSRSSEPQPSQTSGSSAAVSAFTSEAVQKVRPHDQLYAAAALLAIDRVNAALQMKALHCSRI